MADPAAAIARYRAALRRCGETVVVRRYSGTGEGRPYVEAQARARITGYDPANLVGAIVQGDRKVILLAEDVASLLPLVAGDAVIADGAELAIVAVDDVTRRVAGVLVAIELQVRG